MFPQTNSCEDVGGDCVECEVGNVLLAASVVQEDRVVVVFTRVADGDVVVEKVVGANIRTEIDAAYRGTGASMEEDCVVVGVVAIHG